MRITTLLMVSLCLSTTALSQKNKKVVGPPAATSAADRWQGYQQRLQLTENSWVKNVPFRNIGPTIMSGRVVDIEVNPNDPTHFYVAYASGGLWETKNEGITFTPIFDHEMVMTIGDIAVDWSSGAIYVGSGENNSSRSSYSGYGVYRSTDGGKSWQNIGLTDSHHIGRVIVHPTQPNTLWVAALGHLYSENPERGVYKTEDGGKTWRKTLYINERTGIVELVLNPANPSELMAAAWEKDRKAWNFEESGDGSALFKSTDGGESWVNISSGDSGFPDTQGVGRVGLDYARSAPGTVFAILDNQDRREADEPTTDTKLTKEQLRTMTKEAFLAYANSDINAFLDAEDFPSQYNAVDIRRDVEMGKIKPSDLVAYLEDANTLLFDTPVKGAEVYRSDDGGETWKKTHDGYIDGLVYSYGYYFGQIRVDGQNPDILYILGVPLLISKDGGATWTETDDENVHADHHALWVNPSRSGHLINGNDGGVNISYDFGESWIKCNSTPVGQFYTVNFDMDKPYNVYGGLQDNGVWKGPSNYAYSRKWLEEGRYPYERLMGGDGMQVVIDTRTNDVVYTGYQFGNYFRIHTATGERKYITPRHELGEAPYRWNWQAPIQLSSHNQDIVYFGSNRFHRSLDRGENFETLSGDLTAGGKKGDVSYGTLTTISESPKQFGLIYTGSDDGLVHVSTDAGNTWKNISSGLPSQFWVSRVIASAHETNRVYVSLNGYRWDHFEALVYVSENQGQTWSRIGLNLPKEPVNVIKEDPENENILYVGTDHGAYVSLDQGQTFMAFQNGLPAVAVHDLVIHPREKDLILGTHGRSIFVANVAALQQLPDLTSDLHVFAVDEVTYSSRWGSKRGSFGETWEPSADLVIYGTKAATAEISVVKDSVTLHSWTINLDAGLNYTSYGYTLEGNDQNKSIFGTETLEAAENGKYYLPAGKYTLKVNVADTATSTELIVKAPKEQPKRRE